VGGQGVAYAFRPDGQVLAFNLSGTAFVGPPDTIERLAAQSNVRIPPMSAMHSA
jgi:hypothetical protein